MRASVTLTRALESAKKKCASPRDWQKGHHSEMLKTCESLVSSGSTRDALCDRRRMEAVVDFLDVSSNLAFCLALLERMLGDGRASKVRAREGKRRQGRGGRKEGEEGKEGTVYDADMSLI